MATLSQFFHDFYYHTDGLIPVHPLSEVIYPGDFFQVQHGKLLRLGNIAHTRLIDAVEYSAPIRLNPADFKLESGVQRSQFTAELEGQMMSNRSKHVFVFDHRGSYVFTGLEPHSERIWNWG